MRRIITIIFFIFIFIVGVGFSAINMEPVSINYYLGTLTLPLSVIIVLAIVIGTILGALALFTSSMGIRYENRRLNKKLSVSEQEVDSLRILPIKDPHQV